MTQKEEVNLSVIQADEIKKLKEMQKREKFIIDLIKENNLQNDKEFMDEIKNLIDI
ncbi:MAG: hypothetical protein WC872_04205 [Candidatus Absconditabacterales bacterium]|jgi:hypothetical protein